MEPRPTLDRARRGRRRHRSDLNLDQPRPPEDWPDVTPRPLPAYDETLIPLGAPLSPLAQALVMGCLALAEQLGQTVPTSPTPPHSTAHRDSMSFTKPLETCFQV